MGDPDVNFLEVFVREGSVDTEVTDSDSVKQLITNSNDEEKHSDYSESGEEEELNISNNKRKKPVAEDPPIKKRLYVQKYRKDWENIPAYRSWLSESVLGNFYFYCKFCKNDNKCGRTEIEKHMISKKHMKNSKGTLNRIQKKFSFRGLICPVFTPFIKNKDQEVNLTVISEYSDYLHACGIKGILLNDVIGEGMSLTPSERMRITEQWIPQCAKNNQYLMVQVGGDSFKEVQEMVSHAEKKRVGSVVVLPDIHNKPKDHFELMRYIKLVADSASTLPILYHHCPAITGVNISMQKFLQDMVGEVDNFVGIIFSDNNLHEALSALHVNEEKFTVFMGTDEILLGSVASGFTSLVVPSLNFFPKLAQTIFEAVKLGNLTDAKQTQKYLRHIMETIYRYGDFVPAYKAAMNILTPINVGIVRYPLVSVWQDKTSKMKADFQSLRILSYDSAPEQEKNVPL